MAKAQTSAVEQQETEITDGHFRSMTAINKRALSERDICAKYITPAIEQMDVLKVQPLTEFGTPLEIIQMFGGKDQYLAALRELEKQLYAAA